MIRIGKDPFRNDPVKSEGPWPNAVRGPEQGRNPDLTDRCAGPDPFMT